MRSMTVAAVGAAAVAIAACSPRNGAVTSAADALRLDAPSPLDRPFRLKGEKEVDVAALTAMLPAGARPTFETARFDAGLGATVVTKVRFPDPDGEGPQQGLYAGRVELFGVDADAIRRATSGVRDDAAPFETLFRKVRLFDVAPTAAPGEKRAIAGLEIDHLKARRGALTPLAGAARETPAHFLNNFDLAGVYVKGFEMASPEGAPQGSLSVTLPDFRVAGLAGGRIEGLVLKNAEYRVVQTEASRRATAYALGPQAALLLAGPLGQMLAPLDQQVRVGSFEWRRIDVAGWMAKELKGETVSPAEKGLVSLGTIRARTIETRVGGKRAVRSAETTAEAKEFSGTMPTRLVAESKADLYDFTAYLDDKEKAAADVLRKNGLDAVKGRSRGAWTWDPAKGDAGLDVAFNADRLADVDLAFDMAGADAAKMQAAHAAARPSGFFAVGAFKGFTLEIRDKALLSNLFELSALSSGRPAAELRKELPEQLRALGAATAGPRLRSVVEATADFVEQGGVLSISARPTAPIPFSAMAGDPADMSETINLVATHRKPGAKERR